MKRTALLLTIAYLISCGPVDQNADESTVDYSNLTEDQLVEEQNELNQKLRKDVNNAQLFYERSLLNQSKGDLTSAMADIDRALKIEPKNSLFHQHKGTIYVFSNQYVKAEEEWKLAAKLDDANVECRLRLAELNFYKKDAKSAMKYANDALRIDKYNAEAYYIKGLIHIESGDTSLSVSSFQTAVEQNSDYFEAYFQLGMIHAMMLSELSIEYYNNALRIQPENIDVMYNMGLIAQELGNYNLALQSYSKILKIDPNYKHAHFNMGYVNMFYLKVYKQGAVHFTDAIAADPQFYQAYYNRGYCYELMGDVIRAKVDYENALKIKPDYTTAAKGMERVTNF